MVGGTCLMTVSKPSAYVGRAQATIGLLTATTVTGHAACPARQKSMQAGTDAALPSSANVKRWMPE